MLNKFSSLKFIKNNCNRKAFFMTMTKKLRLACTSKKICIYLYQARKKSFIKKIYDYLKRELFWQLCHKWHKNES